MMKIGRAASHAPGKLPCAVRGSGISEQMHKRAERDIGRFLASVFPKQTVRISRKISIGEGIDVGSGNPVQVLLQ